MLPILEEEESQKLPTVPRDSFYLCSFLFPGLIQGLVVAEFSSWLATRDWRVGEGDKIMFSMANMVGWWVGLIAGES